MYEFLFFLLICIGIIYRIRSSSVNDFLQSRIDRQYVYGLCNGIKARKHKKAGNVQFILWKAGEMNNQDPIWHDFDSSHWHNFIETE